MEAKAPSLNLTLYPHRSLSRFGLMLVIGALAMGNIITALFLWSRHMWPVFGFMGLDLALVIAAFWLNNRAARGHEQVLVEGDEVTLIRNDGAHETRRSFNRRWLRIELEYDAARDLVGRLFFVWHGKRMEIARFFGAEEKRALAQALRDAVASKRI